MQYDDLTIMTGRLARGVAIGTFAILMTVMISYEGGIPASHVWLAVGLVAVFAHALTSTLVLPWLVSRYLPSPVVQVVAPEVHPPAPPAPATSGLGEWLARVDWPGLIAYVEQPDAVLSRRGLAGLVDQRFYTPRGEDRPDISFPDLMVKAGAAREVPVNGTSSYIWTPEAPDRLRQLSRSYAPLPSPTGAGNGLVK